MVSPSGEWYRKNRSYGATPDNSHFSHILYCQLSAKMRAHAGGAKGKIG